VCDDLAVASKKTAGAPEITIVVTPEMVSKGSEVLSDEMEDVWVCSEHTDEVVRRILRAALGEVLSFEEVCRK
jgi:hypothetical protein